MEINTNYLEKFWPAASKKSGHPRTEREELIEQFRSKLNEEQKRDNRRLYAYAHLAKRLHGISNSGLYQLFRECDDPGVRSFGAIMTYKLKLASAKRMLVNHATAPARVWKAAAQGAADQRKIKRTADPLREVR